MSQDYPNTPVQSTDEAQFAELVDQLIERLQYGESLELENLVAEFPERAESLRLIWPSLQLMGQLKSSGSNHKETATGAMERLASRQVLGDFRILRQIGRGGMGVVYEAEQISMGRNVALKVLPFAAMANPTALQRFKNEVRSAATLNHTNIVPVFSFGEENGIHFYAMQLIRGHTLADIITALRNLDAENTRLDGSSIVRIVGSSDQHGEGGETDPTTDRESPVSATKPRAFDSTANPHATREFFKSVSLLGVQAGRALDHAHQRGVVHRDIKPGNLMLDADGQLYVTDFGLARIETDAGMTMTGDLVGTLRYMSPEQALAKRVVVDHRTDIYSLGATIYELLTFEPAIQGSDRQEVLRRIAFDEPRKPRAINRSIPAQLETIALKAMAKDPTNRYESGADLADDLQRFLDDQPIRAKRPTWIQRGASWSRRHKTIVASAAILLFVTTIGLALFSLVLVNERNKLTLEQTRSIANLELANSNLDMAMNVLDDVYLPMIETRWTSKSPSAQDQQLIEDGLEFYRQLSQRNENATYETELRRAIALRRMGQLHQAIADIDAAFNAFSESVNLLKEILLDQSENVIVALELAESQNKLIGVFHERGDHQHALALVDSAMDSLDAWAEQREIAISKANLQHWRSTCLLELGRFPEALSSQRQSVTLYRKYIDHPESTSADHGYFLSALMRLSDLEGISEDGADPIAILEEALERTKLVDPERIDEARMFVLRGIGVKLLSRGIRLDEAADRLTEAREINHQLMALEPGIPDHRSMQSSFCNSMGNLAWINGEFDIAEKEFRQAMEISCQLADDYPQSLEYQIEAGQRLREFPTFAMGVDVPGMPAQDQRIDGEEAVVFLKRSQQYFEAALDLASGPEVIKELAMTQTNIALAYGEILQDSAKEDEYYKLAQSQWLRLVREFPDSQDRSRYLMRAGMTFANLASKQPFGSERSIEELEQAVDLQLQAIETKPVFPVAVPACEHHLKMLANSYLQRQIDESKAGLPVMDYPNVARQAERLLELDPNNEFGFRVSNQINAVHFLAYAVEHALRDNSAAATTRGESADQLTQRAKEIIQRAIAADLSEDERYRLAGKQYILGAKVQLVGDPELGGEITVDALKTAEQLIEQNPPPNFRDLFIEASQNAGQYWYTSGQYGLDLQYLRSTIGEIKSLLDATDAQLEGAKFEVSPKWRSREFIEGELESAESTLAAFHCFCPEASFRDPDKALEISERLFAGPNPNSEAKFLYGASLCRAGSHDDAIEMLKNCIAQAPGLDVEVRANLLIAQAYCSKGKLESATRYWDSAAAKFDELRAKNASNFEVEALIEETRTLLDSKLPSNL